MVSLLLLFLLGAYFFFAAKWFHYRRMGRIWEAPILTVRGGQQMAQVETSPAKPLYRVLSVPFKAVAPRHKGGLSAAG